MPLFQNLDKSPLLKPYDSASYIVALDGVHVGKTYTHLKDALWAADLFASATWTKPPKEILIHCELRGRRPQATRLVLTIDQARRIVGSAVSP